MKNIKKRVEKLVRQKSLSGKTIGLISLKFEYYEIAKAFINCGVDVCLVSHEGVCEDDKAAAINCCTFKSFQKTYGKEAAVIISTWDYENAYAPILKKYGFTINKTIFLDCELKTFWKKGLRLIQDSFRRIRGLPFQISFIVRSWLYKLKRLGAVSYGFIVYKKIEKQYTNISAPIYVYDYSGLGDVYVFCLYIKKAYENLSPDGIILTVIGGGSKKVTELFGLKHVVKLSQLESKCLTYLADVAGEKLQIYPLTPFPQHVFTDIYSHYLYGKRLNMAEAYRDTLLNLSNGAIRYPDEALLTDRENTKALFEKNGLQEGKTVILSPYANTIIGYPISFWIKIAEELKKAGFSVCTNCNGSEPEIPGAPALHFSLESAQAVTEYAGYFIGLRSGFCDIICNSSAFKLIIYPEYEIFNTDVYTFCSFERMKIGKNYKEIKWNYENTDALATQLVNDTRDRFQMEEAHE